MLCFRLILLKLIVVMVTQFAAADDETSLIALEYRFVPKLCSAIQTYVNKNHVVPTNITQLQNWLTVEGWASWEERFKKFGEQSGFSNSIFEKYVFLPQGITFRIGPVVVEAVLMSARPFWDGKGGTNRWVIHRSGEIIDRALLPEYKVQEMFRQADAEMPQPPSMISAIELDAPRRREQAQRQHEMEEEIKRFVAEQERGKPVPRPPAIRIPSSSIDHSKDKEGQAVPEPSNPNSRPKFFGVALVLIVGCIFAIFAFRQANRK